MSSRHYPREESWDSLHHSEASNGASEGENDDADMSMDEGSDDGNETSPSNTPALLTVSDVQRALHPLQSTADRVGKQVEQFAETLDRLSTRTKRNPQKHCGHVLPLVQAYKKIASDTVEHLKGIHAPERQQHSSKKWKRKLQNSGENSSSASPRAEAYEVGGKTSVEDLRRWEMEEQTWYLLGLMLEVEYPVPPSDGQRLDSFQGLKRPSRSAGILRYSSERKVWDQFLAHDDLAWERHTVVEWLKKCAHESGQDIDSVVKELELGVDRETGLWAHSWLYTKEAIKYQKRLRSWPQALEPDAPGIDASLISSDRTKPLATQLDPDAVTRQGRSLEKQDQSFERATWLACWEMMRRGKDWDYIRDRCQQVEGWRATIMRGDPRNSQSKEDDRGPDAAASWRSRALWRKTCALAAKTGGIDSYENAVYGVLSGYMPSVLKVSRSWDDYLFAHYNSYLLSQFDRYVRSQCPDRLPLALVQKYGCFDFAVSEGHRTQSGNQIVEKMKTMEATKKEAKQPFKMLQSSLIAKSFDDFVFKQGVKLCQAANTPEKSRILPAMSDALLEGSITAPISMKDYDLLRVITHMLLIFQELGLDIGDRNRRFAAESIIVAYIDYLSKAGKQQILPLYASFLSHERSTTCLGRQLPFIKDPRERQTVMRLMKQCGIDVPGVLNMQLQMIILDAPSSKGDRKTFPSLAILERYNGDNSRVRPIRSNFIGKSVSDDEQDLIHGFEWYMLLQGHWQQTMTTGAVLYKHLLRTRGFAAARVLSRDVTFSIISLGKTESLLGQMVDISKADSDERDEPAAMSRSTRSGRTRSQPQPRRNSTAMRAGNERELLLDQSRTFRDFENLFAALDAMERWKDLADQASQSVNPRGDDGKKWKAEFQEAYDRVEATIQPLLSGWLQYPKDDKEAAEFEQIRVACLPEVVLAYNTVLNFSAHTLSRDLLLRSMDLAVTIAAEESELASCFTAADRMPELVDSFALSSMNVIRAEESGKSKMKPNGERLGIWTAKNPPSYPGE